MNSEEKNAEMKRGAKRPLGFPRRVCLFTGREGCSWGNWLECPDRAQCEAEHIYRTARITGRLELYHKMRDEEGMSGVKFGEELNALVKMGKLFLNPETLDVARRRIDVA